LIKQQYDDDKKHIHVLSYGGGTQSTALLIKALEGEVNGVIPDYIIFSDTGNEPQYVMDQVEKVNKHIKEKYGREVIYTDNGNIYDDLINAVETGERVASLPFHSIDGTGKEYKNGIGMRQCTSEYKIEPVKKKIRELLGYKPRQVVQEKVHIWKGISTDEIQRVKPIMTSKNGEQVPCRWRIAEHPLVDVLSIDRSACIAYVERELGFTPYASACVICPFHDNHAWLEIKRKEPESFEKACQLDEKIRNGLKYQNELYLHKSRKPLREVDLQEDQTTIDDFISECEGFCGL
jgi:hypothetical protein